MAGGGTKLVRRRGVGPFPPAIRRHSKGRWLPDQDFQSRGGQPNGSESGLVGSPRFFPPGGGPFSTSRRISRGTKAGFSLTGRGAEVRSARQAIHIFTAISLKRSYPNMRISLFRGWKMGWAIGEFRAGPAPHTARLEGQKTRSIIRHHSRRPNSTRMKMGRRAAQVTRVECPVDRNRGKQLPPSIRARDPVGIADRDGGGDHRDNAATNWGRPAGQRSRGPPRGRRSSSSGPKTRKGGGRSAMPGAEGAFTQSRRRMSSGGRRGFRPKNTPQKQQGTRGGTLVESARGAQIIPGWAPRDWPKAGAPGRGARQGGADRFGNRSDRDGTAVSWPGPGTEETKGGDPRDGTARPSP